VKSETGLDYGAVKIDANGALALTSGQDQIAMDHNTTGAAANMVIDSVTQIVTRSTSSRRYKQDIEDVEIDPKVVLKMQGRTWRQKSDVEADPYTEVRYVGFIAEELDDLGLDIFVIYDEYGPEAIQYDRLVVALLELVKLQQTQIDELLARVDKLERKK
jgi:hypothetical protein